MRILVAAVVSACVIHSSVLADQSGNAPLEHMTVTASRNPVPMWEAGSSVTVITQADIERRQTPYLVDLLRSVPGLAVNQQGGPGKSLRNRPRAVSRQPRAVRVVRSAPASSAAAWGTPASRIDCASD